MRVPASQAGSVRKMFDFQCPQCQKIWEEMANQTELDTGAIQCSECGVTGTKQFPSPRVDSHAAASWRR